MKRAFWLLPLLLAAAPALAGAKVCINPQWDYEAHALSHDEVYLKATLGKARPALRLTTSCWNLEKPDSISVSAQIGCVSTGDVVVATKIDGHREQCRVTAVAAFPAGATADYKP